MSAAGIRGMSAKPMLPGANVRKARNKLSFSSLNGYWLERMCLSACGFMVPNCVSVALLVAHVVFSCGNSVQRYCVCERIVDQGEFWFNS